MPTYVTKDTIPAADLRAIARLTAQNLKDPQKWTTQALSLDRNGNPVSVYSDRAEVLDIIGHVTKAAQRHFGFKSSDQMADRDDREAQKILAVVNQIDAQVRFVSARQTAGEVLYTSMVTHAHNSGRQELISILHEVVRHLDCGDAGIVPPYDVGVQQDLADITKKRVATKLDDSAVEDEEFEEDSMEFDGESEDA
jgi:hypothetical protein